MDSTLNNPNRKISFSRSFFSFHLLYSNDHFLSDFRFHCQQTIFSFVSPSLSPSSSSPLCRGVTLEKEKKNFLWFFFLRCRHKTTREEMSLFPNDNLTENTFQWLSKRIFWTEIHRSIFDQWEMVFSCLSFSLSPSLFSVVVVRCQWVELWSSFEIKSIGRIWLSNESWSYRFAKEISMKINDRFLFNADGNEGIETRKKTDPYETRHRALSLYFFYISFNLQIKVWEK